MVNRFFGVAHLVFVHKKHRTVVLEMWSFSSAGRNVVLEMSLVGLGTRIEMQTSARRRFPLKSWNSRRGAHSNGSKQPEAVGRWAGRSGFGSWGWAAVVGGWVGAGVVPIGWSQSQITCAKDFGVLFWRCSIPQHCPGSLLADARAARSNHHVLETGVHPIGVNTLAPSGLIPAPG